MNKLWVKKKIKVLCWIIIVFVSLGILVVKYSRRDVYKHLTGFGEHIYQNVNHMNEKETKRFCSFLEIEKFPETATDIYIYLSAAVGDKTVFCSMTLLPEKIPEFVKYFIGVPLSVFKEGVSSEDDIISHEIYLIGEGDTYSGLIKNWNVKSIQNGKYFEVLRTEKSKEEFKRLRMKVYGESEEDAKAYYGAYRDRYIAIDMDTNRVYLCVQ